MERNVTCLLKPVLRHGGYNSVCLLPLSIVGQAFGPKAVSPALMMPGLLGMLIIQGFRKYLQSADFLSGKRVIYRVGFESWRSI